MISRASHKGLQKRHATEGPVAVGSQEPQKAAGRWELRGGTQDKVSCSHI